MGLTVVPDLSLYGLSIMKAKSVYNNLKQYSSRSCGIEDNASFAPTNACDSSSSGSIIPGSQESPWFLSDHRLSWSRTILRRQPAEAISLLWSKYTLSGEPRVPFLCCSPLMTFLLTDELPLQSCWSCRPVPLGKCQYYVAVIISYLYQSSFQGRKRKTNV